MMNGQPDKSDAFVLTGAFWAICRNSLYIKEIANKGLKVLIVTPESYRKHAEIVRKDPNSPASFIDDIAYVQGALDKEASFNPSFISLMQSWKDKYNIVGAYAAGETLVEPTGLLADAYELLSPGLRATKVCRSKYLQRFFLEEFSPVSITVPSSQRETLDLEGLRYPVIIKPATRHSSSGVVSAKDSSEAKIMIKDYPDYETILLEERIVGQEYSVESLMQDGKIIFSSATKKVTTDTYDNTFVELSHTVPYLEADAEVLLQATEQVIKKLDLQNGITHVEWRITSTGKPYLIEIAARTPGDGLTVLYQLACGESLEPKIINIMLGEKTSFPKPNRIARQVYMEHDIGQLKDVTLDWEGVNINWIAESDVWPALEPSLPDDPAKLKAVFVLKEKGSDIGVLRSSEDRAVTFIIDAPTLAELDEFEAKVRSRIGIVTEPTIPN